MSAGTRTVRTTKASTKIAAARPTPNCRMMMLSTSRNDTNTRIMMLAAAVITRPVTAWPVVTATRLSPVRIHSSRIRLTRNTS
jgi:hypothetical protein